MMLEVLYMVDLDAETSADKVKVLGRKAGFEPEQAG